ncbi:MAG: type II toxin-antitoxin system RelE/ParE family toxin [Bosea sp. (in: a-proteobacteria)]|jgi:putative addiction module killer protein|nr:type II toxin-antitoxin system RelE/ParE family toxin [Bosea sp. (in: a-proteobacteria)]
MSVEVEVYEDENGVRPFDVWFDGLPPAHAAKVTAAVTRLGAGGQSGLKAVGHGVSEWRIDWGPGIRIYLAFDGTRLIILLGGGTKSRQQADIARAIERWTDYRRRKKAAKE